MWTKQISSLLMSGFMAITLTACIELPGSLGPSSGTVIGVDTSPEDGGSEGSVDNEESNGDASLVPPPPVEDELPVANPTPPVAPSPVEDEPPVANPTPPVTPPPVEDEPPVANPTPPVSQPPQAQVWYMSVRAVDQEGRQSPDSNEVFGELLENQDVTLTWNSPNTTLDGACASADGYVVQMGTASGVYTHTITVQSNFTGLFCAATGVNICGNTYTCEMDVIVPSS